MVAGCYVNRYRPDKVSICLFYFFYLFKLENVKITCFWEAWQKSKLFTHHSHYIKLHSINTIPIICVGTVITDTREILALVLSFVFLFGFTQVRFNFIDDVISLYEVG